MAHTWKTTWKAVITGETKQCRRSHSSDLATMQSRRQVTSNLAFFSKDFSVNGAVSAPQPTQLVGVVVKGRSVEKNTGAVKVVARDATPAAASSSSRASSLAPSDSSKKRKSPTQTPSEPPKGKRPRLSGTPSESRAQSAAPSEVPSTRADSVAPSRQESLTPHHGGVQWIDEHGRPGSELLSSEITVRNVKKTYKARK